LDARADTTGREMLTDWSGLAEFELELIHSLTTLAPHLKTEGMMMGRKPKLPDRSRQEAPVRQEQRRSPVGIRSFL
jgi:hypothetical protein